MKMIDSIHSIYDKKRSAFISGCNTFEFIEDTPNATFKKLVVKSSCLFDVIKNDFYKGLSAITTDRSSFLQDKDCDGVVICDNSGTTQLVFIDLKSSFKQDNIEKAFKQDFFTFIKLHLLLSLCKGYSIRECYIVCYVACPRYTSQEEVYIKDNISMTEEKGDSLINKCLKEYFFGTNDFHCKIKDIPYIANKMINEDILSIDIHFKIYTTKHYSDSCGVLHI